MNKRQIHYDNERRVLIMQPNLGHNRSSHQEGTYSNSYDQQSFSGSKDWKVGIATSVGVGSSTAGPVGLKEADLKTPPSSNSRPFKRKSNNFKGTE